MSQRPSLHARNVGALFVVAAAVIASPACKDDPEPQPVATTPPPVTAAPEPTSTGPTVISLTDTKPGITPRVKAEVDNRADGITGTALAVTGATASMQSPTGWNTTKGDVTVSASADNKAQLGVAPIGAEGASGKVAAVVSALGLTECQWNSEESVTLGKSKLPATAADGVCKRGATKVETAYVAPSAEKLLVVGAWEPGGDMANVFGAMRSVAKAGGGGGDPTGIAACCAALRQNGANAPPEQKGAYMMAAGACDALKSNPQGRAALGQVRAMLRGMNAPSSCM